MSINVSIVIVNWNSQELLKQCITSIYEHTRTSFEIVVIDSASFDGCERMLHDHFPEVTFIQSQTNLGFARANNCAFERATGDGVLFLNPDTELVGPAIDQMYAALTTLPNAGLIGCKLFNADGSVQSSCIQSIPTILNQVLDSELLRERWPRSGLWGTAPLHEAVTMPQEAEAISGACVMVKRRVFEQVGRFTEEYFMYAEDIDLAHKVRTAGFHNYFLADASVIHYGGGSSQQAESRFSVVMTREAIWRFLRRTRGTLYGFGYRAAMAVSALVRLLLIGMSALVRNKRSVLADPSFRKWLAILDWSLDRDDLVKQYYPRPGVLPKRAEGV